MQKYHDEPKQYKGYLKSALGYLPSDDLHRSDNTARDIGDQIGGLARRSVAHEDVKA